ncbi:penicillin-binding protein activator [Frigidibacter sp. RF13]|uniref:penicillin-binding protein activator n=1 Tax=Frigidibacter sp. RF13 TaxID=2997340 RepID=UPI00226FFB7C|nr:penicillin-binding protein activator [Frigidibacter sp. RF13]MCY1126179.1 penicillin-binding protein activator [Frigidibacter sp. RF13]
MLSVSLSRRKFLKPLAASAVALALAACEPLPTASRGPGWDPTKPVPVALLLPSGSGNAGDDILARDLKQAAEMAIADLSGTVDIDLRVYNAGADPSLAAQMANQAVTDGAVIILGPVFGDSANAAGVAVKGNGVNVLSFSNNTDIAGGNVFVLGPTFQNAAQRLTGYAARQGKGNILIVQDKTPQGDLGGRAVTRAAAGSGAKIVGTVPYEFSGPGVTAAIPTIVATARSTGAQSLFFTADSAGALPLLAETLPQAGLGPTSIQYAGLTRWDIPPATLSLPGLQGGWFALPDPGMNTAFQSRFTAKYGNLPHPIAGLAYDGVAAIGALVKSGQPNPFSGTALTQGAGYVGVNGIFRLMGDGTNQRGLAIAQIQNGSYTIVDPAPRSFGGAGF